MADQIIDQHCNPADSQSSVDKLNHLLRRKMVGEQVAAQQIETCSSKGKSESIAGDCAVSIAQMRRGTIEQCDLQVQPAMLEPLARSLRDVSRPGGNFQQRQEGLVDFACHALNHILGRGDASEPAIDPPQIAERSSDLGGRAGVRVEQFGCGNALHGKVVVSRQPPGFRKGTSTC